MESYSDDDDAVDDEPVAISGALVLLTAFAVLGGFLFGYDTGVVSGAEVFVQDDLNLTDSQIQVVVSLTVLFAAVGAAAAGAPMQKYGRKPLIMLASFFYGAGSTIVAFAPSYGVLARAPRGASSDESWLWIVRGDGSRRRRGRDADSPRRRVAATPRRQRG